MGDPVVGQLGPHAPLGHRGGATAVPHPAPVQVAGVGAEADPAEVHVLAEVDREPAPHLGAAPAARAPGPVPVAVRAVPLVPRAVDGERARPAPGLLEMPLADGPGRRRRLGRLRAAARLPVRADGGGDGVEAHVEGHGDGPGRRLTAHARTRLHLALHAEVPRLQRLEHLVADRADLEHGVDHLALLLDPAVLAETAVGQPQRQADVHRPLVGPDADAAEQARVRARVVRVEVVRLAPGGIAFDGVGQVVAGFEDRHGYTIVCPALTFNASPVTPRAASESSQQMAPAISSALCRRPSGISRAM